MDNKTIIGIIIALIIIVVAIVAVFNFTNLNPINVNVTNDSANATTEPVAVINNTTDDTKSTDAAANTTETTSSDSSANSSDASSTDSGDVLQKTTFTVSENETGQNEGMEPGKYILYYTANDGPIKIEKIA